MSGRPSKLLALSDAEKSTLLNYLRAGNFRITACEAVGISPDTLKNWEERAGKGEEPFGEFMAEVARVEALAEVETANVIAMCARGEVPKGKDGQPLPEDLRPVRDWKAAAFLLERRGARRWAPVQKSELTGKDGAPLAAVDPSPEAAAALLRASFGDHARHPLQDDEAPSPLEKRVPNV